MNDLKFACRQLLKNPGFTVVVVVTLALGIGASTAIYSVVSTVLLNPVPGPEPDRLMQIAERDYHVYDKTPLFNGVSSPVLEALRENQEFFSDFVWWDGLRLERKTEDFVDGFGGAMVPPSFFTLWNIQPILGRTFAKDEATPLNKDGRPAADSVIVLSYSLWKSLFGGDPGAIGKTIELLGEGTPPNMGGHHFTVIGVMPPHFQFPQGAYPIFWLPSKPVRLPPGVMTGPNTHVLVRLKPGVNQQQVQAMLDTVAQRLSDDPTLARAYRYDWGRRHGLGLWLRPLRYEFTEGSGYAQTVAIRQNLHQTLFGLLGAIGFVLLIVCVNVANLTLARTEKRQQELAVRAALGAGRVRLARQLLTESVLLSCLGGLGGLLVTIWGVKLLASLIPVTMPRLKPIQIDGHALGFALLVSIATGLAFGLAPAWRAGRARLHEALKQAGTGATVGAGRSRYRSALVIAEVALTLVLLTGAGLMIQSVVRLLHVNPGFDPENLLFVYFHLPNVTRSGEKYSDPQDREQRALKLRNALFARLHDRFSVLPGVKAVGFLKGNEGGRWNLRIDGRAEPAQGYPAGCGVEESDPFRAMHVPLLAGRYFNRTDIAEGYFYMNNRIEGISSVIINETMARLCWPGEEALGKEFQREDPRSKRTYEVVGVVGDWRYYRYDQKVLPTFYRPYHESDSVGSPPCFVVRTERDPRGLLPIIRKELKSAEPDMITPTIHVARQRLYDSTQAQRTYMRYLVAFAGVGLLLSALGIYGVLAYSVARRTREIGIRMAVGAERRHVLVMVMAEGARLVSIGVVVGLLAAFWLTRLVQKQLFEVSPTDPVVFAGVVLLLSAVALLACYIPARRATKIDPMTALRYE